MFKKIGISATLSKIIWAVVPALSFWLLESLVHSVGKDMKWPLILANLIFYYLWYGFLLVLTKRSWASISFGSLTVMIVGLINYYVISFRSVPFYPWDILSLKTAASVSDNFDYSLDRTSLCIVAGFVLLAAVGLFCRWRLCYKSGQHHLLSLLGMMTAIALFCTSVQMDSMHQKLGFYEYLFTPNAYYQKNGFAASFISNMQYLNISKPGNYSLAKVSELQAPYGGAGTAGGETGNPNVIVIMNEAFSDPAVLGDFETNVDYMPFIRSLTENTVKGNLFVSVKGGNTANTEYEFLTGDSMAYLPAGSVPYQQYIHSEMPTMVSQLRGMGYETFSIHPYRANGWNRRNVYKYFGFENSYFKESFTDAPVLREYTTDLATYQKIVDIYHAKEAGQPMFVFDVTMQNHSSYSKEYENFIPDVEVYGSEKDKLLERYLSLIKVSDEAFEKLVEYFDNMKEPTVILMFGDHQPADWVVEPIYSLNGLDSSDLSLEESQKRYEVPFVIWANYDIEETYIEGISVNYLSALLFEKAGIELSGYQSYLKALSEEYPVVTANAYIDSEGFYTAVSNGDVMPEMLNGYRVLNYNHLFDSKHRSREWYE